MSTPNLKKISTYTRIACDILAIDFSYKILYSVDMFKSTRLQPLYDLKLGQLQVELNSVITNLSQPVLIPDPLAKHG